MRIRTTLLLASLVSAGLLATAVPATAQPSSRLVPVIVRLQAGADPATESDEVTRQGAQLRFTYRNALRGFALQIPERLLPLLQRNPRVLAVEADAPVSVGGEQVAPPWGLDRIDQRDAGLDGRYTYPRAGEGVTAYVIDTGIRRDHREFTGRIGTGYDAAGGRPDASDCHGHGTHVAGTVGGSTYGVAKAVTLVPVRVLGCTGSGSTSALIAGLDWVARHHTAGVPAVANISIGGPTSTSLDTAVRNVIADGVTVAVSAGNDTEDACGQSPARVADALTVGASTEDDDRSGFSNFGSCVDMYAPGVGIASAGTAARSAVTTMSGTSMASPHVAGAAAVLLSQRRSLTPAAVADRLRTTATRDVIPDPVTGTADLLYVESPATTTLTVSGPATEPRTEVGRTAALTVTADGGTSPYRWAARGLPTGLSIDASSGVITGTPTTAGDHAVTVTATDDSGATASTTFNWVITPRPCPAPGQKLLNPGLEPGSGGWSATSGVFLQSPDRAHSGVGYAQLGGRGRSAVMRLQHGSITLPAGCSTYTLSFWMRVESTETGRTAADRMTVQFGSTSVATHSQLNRSTGYVQKTVDLGRLAGRSGTLTFTSTEDGDAGATAFLVDDVTLDVR